MADAVARVPDQHPSKLKKSVHEVVESEAFKSIVRRRWTVNLVLLAMLFVTYYGYILLIAYAKPLMATKIGEYTTLGIPVGVAVIVIGWALTAWYVVWANTKYDPEVERIKKELQ